MLGTSVRRYGCVIIPGMIAVPFAFHDLLEWKTMGVCVNIITPALV